MVIVVVCHSFCGGCKGKVWESGGQVWHKLVLVEGLNFETGRLRRPERTALSHLFPNVPDEQSASLRADGSLLSLYEAFAAVPDPRSRHGQRYDLPYLLTCLVAALLCNCKSLEAVGQWCRDQSLLLRRLLGPRDFYTPTGSLYRRLLPRLSVGHIELVLAAWVQASRSEQDGEAV